MAENDNNQFLTFTMDDETYAMNVMQVREVLEHTKITRVPKTPEFMLGAINLRGSVVPVVDLRIKFDLNLAEINPDTSIIVVEIDLDNDLSVIGLLVDSVHEVLELSPDQIEPAPAIGSRINTEFIHGMGKRADSNDFIIILNIEKIFSEIELNILNKSTEKTPVQEIN